MKELEDLFVYDLRKPKELKRFVKLKSNPDFLEKEYGAYAIVTKNGMALRSIGDGRAAIYWDKRLAEDNLKKGEEVVKCDVKIWKRKEQPQPSN